MQFCSRTSFLALVFGTLLSGSPTGLADGQVVISEFLASNHSDITDEDGVWRDWIEVHNTGPAINLQGWYLTDDPDELTMWEFPDTPLAADGRLVVFASDMNRTTPGSPLHTNFRISANGGGYLAIVEPNGVTVSHAYVGYPTQYSDITYGINGASTGFLATPTPAQPNAGLRPLPPSLAPTSKFFAGTCSIVMTKPEGIGTLRYTTNGTTPTLTNGYTYTAPVSLMNTTTIKAAIYDAGVRSPVITERYVRLANDVQNFNSDLPLVVVHSLNTEIPEDPQVLCVATVIGTTNGRATITDPPNFIGTAGIKLRGSSSLSFPKKQYAFEIWDHNGDDESAPLLDLPKEEDWVLYGPYTDKTLMRDCISYQWSNEIGRYAPRTRYVEMFLHTVSGAVNSTDYVGTYAIVEKIKRDGERVNIEELRPDDNTEPKITGGYIVKKDRLDPGDVGFWTNSGQNLCYVEPKEAEISPEQSAYLINYFNEFEAALAGPNFADPLVGYAKYIDVDSWIDHHLLTEMTKNIDGYRLSTFLFKDRGGKLNMGPIWDYNLTLGNADYLQGWLPQGWYYPQLSAEEYPWWPRLFQDEAFRVRYADRWFSLRETVFATSHMLADIDAHAAVLAESQVRNFVRWPILGEYVWPNAPGWAQRDTYEKEVDWMKNWLVNRLAWIDTQFIGPPVFNQDGGSVPYGFQLTMTPPAGATGTIRYTLDGSDPYFAETTSVTLVVEDAAKRVRVPTGPITGWNTLGFDDSAWTSGTGGVGYERSTGYEDLIGIDVEAAMYGVNGTCYIRVPFSVDAGQLAQFAGLTLRVRYDDGFVAYLNGQEIARSGSAPASPQWNSEAMYIHDDSAAVLFEDFDVAAQLGALQAGNNVLAIHGLNAPATSSDFLISVELVAASVGAPTALTYTGPITLTDSAHVKARLHTSTTWGALNEAIFTVGELALYINEFMADNDAVLEDPDEPGEFPDWLEIYNPMPSTALLGGMYLTDDLSEPTKWQIPAGVSIPPGGYLVFYCDEDPEQGPTHADIKLSKSGEAIGLFNTAATGYAPIDTLTFGAQTTNVSSGRYPNGTGAWRFFANSTPGSANLIHGDLNCDGVVNFADINPFVLAISNPAAWEATYPGCPTLNGDMNGDGDFNFGDINPFVACLSTGVCP